MLLLTRQCNNEAQKTGNRGSPFQMAILGQTHHQDWCTRQRRCHFKAPGYGNVLVGATNKAATFDFLHPAVVPNDPGESLDLMVPGLHSI